MILPSVDILGSIAQLFRDFVEWITDAIVGVLQSLLDVFYDAVLAIFKEIFGVIKALIEAIPVPDFLVRGVCDMSGFPEMYFFISTLMIPQGMTLLASAFAFRMVRKAVTLFQW